MSLRLLGVRRGGRDFQILALPIDNEVPPHAIVGEVDVIDGKPIWKTFRRNVVFVDFYTRYMRGELSQRPAALGGPPVKPGEHIYIIDKRADDPRGDVPFSEIVGWYKSTGTGSADATTFEYNKKHAFVRADGRISEALDDPRLLAAAADAR